MHESPLFLSVSRERYDKNSSPLKEISKQFDIGGRKKWRRECSHVASARRSSRMQSVQLVIQWAHKPWNKPIKLGRSCNYSWRSGLAVCQRNRCSSTIKMAIRLKFEFWLRSISVRRIKSSPLLPRAFCNLVLVPLLWNIISFLASRETYSFFAKMSNQRLNISFAKKINFYLCCEK